MRPLPLAKAEGPLDEEEWLRRPSQGAELCAASACSRSLFSDRRARKLAAAFLA